jgi:hypothetical protein
VIIRYFYEFYKCPTLPSTEDKWGSKEKNPAATNLLIITPKAKGTVEEIAQRYSVGITAIRHIKIGKTWRHATPDLGKAPQNVLVAEKFGVCSGTVQRIKNNKWFGQKVIKIRFSGPK